MEEEGLFPQIKLKTKNSVLIRKIEQEIDVFEEHNVLQMTILEDDELFVEYGTCFTIPLQSKEPFTKKIALIPLTEQVLLRLRSKHLLEDKHFFVLFWFKEEQWFLISANDGWFEE